MKKTIFLVALALVGVYGNAAMPEIAYSNAVAVEEVQNELTTVVFSATIHCDNCKKKIEKNLAFEKGVKEIKVDVKSKTVTVTFKSNKNTPEALKKALKKLGYDSDIKIVK